MRVLYVHRLILTVGFVLSAGIAFADSTFIRFGCTWKYLDNGTDPGSIWKDSSASGTDFWASGPSKFGYGNNNERTRVNYGGNTDNKYITTYFRTSFIIPNKDLFSFYRIKAYLDDGMVVYVNGIEVCRTNIGNGEVKYNTFASRGIPENGNIQIPFDIPGKNFVRGNNTIAVEVHQSHRGRNDLTFDLQLTGISKDTATEITRGPLLQMVSEEAITLIWKTNVPASSKVYYGILENALTTFIQEDALSKDHEIRITGLIPDTKYFYAVGDIGNILEGSYRNYFTTSPPASTKRKIKIGVFGDAGSGNGNQKLGRDNYLRQFKKEDNAEIALFLGDNAYNTGTNHEYQTNFFNVYDKNIFDNHIVFPIPGNHDYYSPGVPYFSIFTLPTAGESGGFPSGTESYYSFNYGNIHFIMLNSMGSDNGSHLGDSTGQQASWLKKDLEANAGTHKWTIACLHHPPYTNGTHNSDGEPELIAIRQQITPILERYGVDAVLAGHSHVYERSFLIQGHTGNSKSFKASPSPDGNLVNSSSARYNGTINSCPYFTVDTVAKKGTVYVVAGSAGQIGGGTNQHLPVFYYKNYSGTTGGESGILYLEVQDNRLDAKFIGESGTIHDRFTIMKGVNTKKVLTVDINQPLDLTASWIGNYNWLPEPPAGKDNHKMLTVKPAKADTYTYFVKDNPDPVKTCISDTFEVHASSAAVNALVKFEARQKYNSVVLKWSAEKDPDNDYFTIERSSNGRDFTMLTMVKATFASNPGGYSFYSVSVAKAASYEFEDNYPVHGNNYYRLKKTLKNNQTTLIGQRIVNFEEVKSFTYSMKSNSNGKNILNIDIESSKKQVLKINLFDMTGRVIYNNKLAASQGFNNVTILLTAGIYVLNIVSPDNTRISDKIVLK